MLYPFAYFSSLCVLFTLFCNIVLILHFRQSDASLGIFIFCCNLGVFLFSKCQDKNDCSNTQKLHFSIQHIQVLVRGKFYSNIKRTIGGNKKEGRNRRNEKVIFREEKVFYVHRQPPLLKWNNASEQKLKPFARSYLYFEIVCTHLTTPKHFR